MQPSDDFHNSVTMSNVSRRIWDEKFRLQSACTSKTEANIEETWLRVANALAEVETQSDAWSQEFYSALEGFQFIPAGRILSGAGTGRDVTLANCFVMGAVEDSVDGIFAALGEAAKTIKAGGGIGYDFSTIRPKGDTIWGVEAKASGPVSFMEIWNTMCGVMQLGGVRRGAMMAVLSCSHPDIEEFVEAKLNGRPLSHFNMSVLVPDAFMDAVQKGRSWELSFGGESYGEVNAADLWDKIMRSNYESAEPGVIFIDQINSRNNLSYVEHINATNPCGEQPLPPYGACILGSINLAALIEDPFLASASLHVDDLDRLTSTAVRMLDNALDVSWFPLPAQSNEAQAKRRIGLGITGLADALAMCGLRYGSDEAVTMTESWLERIVSSAYRTSALLAQEKGPFPLFNLSAYEANEIVGRLPEDVRDLIRTHGLRNGVLTTVAPTGTISLLAGNVSSGIEPIFSLEYARNIRTPNGEDKTEIVSDYAVSKFRGTFGDTALPGSFVTTDDLKVEEHVRMLSVAQKWVDSAISKTINVPSDYPFEEFKGVYTLSFQLGCKGCTTYRPNPRLKAVLSKIPSDSAETKDTKQKEYHLPSSEEHPICYDCG